MKKSRTARYRPDVEARRRAAEKRFTRREIALKIDTRAKESIDGGHQGLPRYPEVSPVVITSNGKARGHTGDADEREKERTALKGCQLRARG